MGATYFGQFRLWPELSSILANFYFGQSYFGQFEMFSYFGQFQLWPVLLWPIWASEKKHREKNIIRGDTNNFVRFLGENVAGRRPAMLHMKVC